MFNELWICECHIWAETSTAMWMTVKEAAAMKILIFLISSGSCVVNEMICVDAMQRMQLSIHRTHSII